MSAPSLERWLSKAEIAEHLGCSTKSIDLAARDGLPHAVIFGRRKFRASEVVPWLEEHGRFRREGKVAANDQEVPDAA